MFPSLAWLLQTQRFMESARDSYDLTVSERPLSGRSRRGFGRQGWRALVVAGLCAVPSLLTAQVANTFATETLSGWRLSIGMAESWDANLQFQSTSAAPSSGTRVRAEGARLWQGRRDRSLLSFGGGFVQYPQQPQLNQYAYELGASSTHQFSRRLSSELSARAISNLSNQSVANAGSGALLPGLYQVRSAQASAGVNYRISRRLDARISASEQTVVVGGLANGNGRVGARSAELTGRASRATTLGVLAEYQRSVIGATTVRLPRLAFRADQRLSPRFALAVVMGSTFASAGGGLAGGGSAGAGSAGAGSAGAGSAGAGSAGAGSAGGGSAGGGSAGGGASRPQLNGSGTLTFQDRTTELALDARRSVGQEFGQASNGVLLTNNVGLSYRRTFSHTLQIQARRSEAWTSGIAGATPPVRSSAASAELRYISRANVAFNLGAFAFRRVDQRASVSHGVSAGVAYSWSQLHMPPAIILP